MRVYPDLPLIQGRRHLSQRLGHVETDIGYRVNGQRHEDGQQELHGSVFADNVRQVLSEKTKSNQESPNNVADKRVGYREKGSISGLLGYTAGRLADEGNSGLWRVR